MNILLLKITILRSNHGKLYYKTEDFHIIIEV